MPESRFHLANFMRAHLYAAIAAVKVGLDLLIKEENVAIDSITAHGGFFKTAGVGQRYLSAALDAPVTVHQTANEGGAWGIALLALYLHEAEADLLSASGDADKFTEGRQQLSLTLESWLQENIFAGQQSITEYPSKEEVTGFLQYIQRDQDGIAVERAAVSQLK